MNENHAFEMMKVLKREVVITMSVVVMMTACNGLVEKPIVKNTFSTEILLKHTPVKDQGNSQLCWVYAMLATIESEHLMMGDSVNLSVDYAARMLLSDQLQRYYLSKGKKSISMRGVPTMLIHELETHGIVPYDSYRNKDGLNYEVLVRKLMHLAKSQSNLSIMNSKMEDIMDREIEYLPRRVYMLGAEYTPLEFAHSVCKPDEYVALTSFTHHPFYQPFELEIPDNQLNDSFMNVPIDSLMKCIETALCNGHPVCWEGDVSEPGFSFSRGVAKLQGKVISTQEKRQRDFESLKTTDDHCMELIGIARNDKGNLYFIAKGSWGTNNPYGGLMYMSFDYVRMKTIAVFMSREAMGKVKKNKYEKMKK